MREISGEGPAGQDGTPDVASQRDQNPGQWIERQCRELGVSVNRVAREANIDRTTVFRWSKGRASPYWDSFRRVKLVIDRLWDERREMKEGA